MDMSPDAIDALCRTSGVLDHAVIDARHRVQAHFAGEQPEPAAISRWLTETLRPVAAHLFPQTLSLAARLGMSEGTFSSMPSAWRLEQARAHQPPVTKPHPNRPVPKDAPQDVQAQWKNLSPAERITAYRAWRDERQG